VMTMGRRMRISSCEIGPNSNSTFFHPARAAPPTSVPE
jgi:hypothetical protein